MRAVDIIAAKANPEGFESLFSQESLAKFLLGRVAKGEDIIMRFGPVVFTVAKDPKEPLVHIYSAGTGAGLLTATERFHRAVWGKTKHRFLLAPIDNLGVQKLAERFGWVDTGRRPMGFSIYLLRRPRT
jgi:hypothetical protein